MPGIFPPPKFAVFLTGWVPMSGKRSHSFVISYTLARALAFEFQLSSDDQWTPNCKSWGCSRTAMPKSTKRERDQLSIQSSLVLENSAKSQRIVFGCVSRSAHSSPS